MTKQTMISTMRQLGKSQLNLLASQLINIQPMTGKTGSIFNMNPRYSSSNYKILKSWTAGRGRKMHRVQVRYEVLEWLYARYNQNQEQFPSWWVYEGHTINITEHMLMIVRLRWTD